MLICRSFLAGGFKFSGSFALFTSRSYPRMISSGDWGVNELMKYLVAIKETLTPTELERLRKTSAFPQESFPESQPDSKQPIAGTPPTKQTVRSIPGLLYEPTDTMRELRLPILDWGSSQKWRPNSEEGM